MNNHYDLVSVAGDVMLRENGEELMLLPEQEFDDLCGEDYDLDDDLFGEDYDLDDDEFVGGCG